MNDNEFLHNIWELYGVKENPFSTSPILVHGGTIPIESFVGRTDDIKRLGKIFASKGGSRCLVFGDVGVGKTTFVNVARHYASKKNFFTPFKEIAVQESWTPTTFILNTISSIYSTLKLLPYKLIDDKTFKKLEALLEINSHDRSFGLSFGGVGANYGVETRVPIKITTHSLHDFFQELIAEIVSKTNHDVIIHYNNLELLPEVKFRKLFNNLRDFFQTANIHFVFVGNLTIYSYIQSMPRISSILTDTPIHLETLSMVEVEEIIKKRFEALKIPDICYIIPYDKEALTSLFELWGGNIRHILNSLSTAISEVTTERAIILDKNLLAVTLQEVLDKRYLYKIAPRAKDILTEIIKHKEITNKSLSDKFGIPRSNISTYIKDLHEQGCIYLRRKTGKDKFWSAEPIMKWALLKVVKKHQTSLFSYR